MNSKTFTVYHADEGKVFVNKDDYNVFGEQVILDHDEQDIIENYKQLTKTYHDKWLKEHQDENSNQE